MKQLIILISILAFSALPFLKGNNKQKEYITIIHIGSSDKPIYAINISKDSLEKEHTTMREDIEGQKNYFNSRNYVVSSETYEKLEKIVFKFRKHNQSQMGYMGEFEFQVNNNEKYNFILRRKKSIKLIKLIIKEIKFDEKNNKLNSSFVGLLEQIK